MSHPLTARCVVGAGGAVEGGEGVVVLDVEDPWRALEGARVTIPTAAMATSAAAAPMMMSQRGGEVRSGRSRTAYGRLGAFALGRAGTGTGVARRPVNTIV